MTQAFSKVTAIRGMNDALPGSGARWEQLEELVRCWLSDYGYRNMRTPILEH
jgi:histidyl-tRNA synthetase